MMKLLAEVSAGELIYKIRILDIKIQFIHDEVKRANVEREYAALIDVLNEGCLVVRSYAYLQNDRRPI